MCSLTASSSSSDCTTPPYLSLVVRSAPLDLATDAFATSHLVDSLDLDATDLDAIDLDMTSSSSSPSSPFCDSDIDMLALSSFESVTSPTAKSFETDAFGMQSALFDFGDAMMWTPDDNDDGATTSDGFESDDSAFLALSAPSSSPSSPSLSLSSSSIAPPPSAAAMSVPTRGRKCASRLEVGGSWVKVKMSDVVVLETSPTQPHATHATASEPPSPPVPTPTSPVSTPRVTRRRAAAAASAASISPVNTRQRTAMKMQQRQQDLAAATTAPAATTTAAADTTANVRDRLQTTTPSPLQRPQPATGCVSKTTTTKTTAPATTLAKVKAPTAAAPVRRPRAHRAAAIDPTARAAQRKTKQRGYERNYRGRLQSQRCHDEVTWLKYEAVLRRLKPFAHKQALVLGPRSETKAAAIATTASANCQRVLRKYTQLVHEECALKEERAYLRAVESWRLALDIWGFETEASCTLRYELNTLPRLHAHPTFTDFVW